MSCMPLCHRTRTRTYRIGTAKYKPMLSRELVKMRTRLPWARYTWYDGEVLSVGRGAGYLVDGESPLVERL